MKNIIKKTLIISVAISFLGVQGLFAADQAKDRTRDRVQDQTCIKDGSGKKIKVTNQNRKTLQTKQAYQKKKNTAKTDSSGK